VNRLSTDRGNWSTKTAKGPAISPTIGNAERTKARTLVMRLAPRTGFHPQSQRTEAKTTSGSWLGALDNFRNWLMHQAA